MSRSPSEISQRSLKPSVSPSLSPQKRPYVPYIPGPSGPGPQPEQGIMSFPPPHPEFDMDDDMLSDDEAQSIPLDDVEHFRLRHEEEGEMELDELDTVEPEEAEDGVPGWRCAWNRCGKIWKDQQGLVRHIHKDHIGINREWYSCKWDDCRRRGDKQATRHALITHVRAHTGERPYTCTQPNCNKTFTRSDAMNKHLRSIHSVPAELANPRTAARVNSRPTTVDQPEFPSVIPPGMDGTPRTGTPAGDIAFRSPSQPHNPSLPPDPSLPPSRQSSIPGEKDKPKAKSRARTTAPKKPVIPRIKRPPLIPIPGVLPPTVPEYTLRRDSHSQPPVTVGPDGVTYIRFGSDADLMTDSDLYDVLPRIRNRPVLQVTHEDVLALEHVRTRFPRRGEGAIRTNKGKKREEEGEKAREGDDESDDSFDEGTAKVHPDESGLEIGRIGEAGVLGERSVFGRSRWAAKYIMAKAKLMLAEEEMRMRLAEHSAILEEEAGLRQALEEMGDEQ